MKERSQKTHAPRDGRKLLVCSDCVVCASLLGIPRKAFRPTKIATYMCKKTNERKSFAVGSVNRGKI